MEKKLANQIAKVWNANFAGSYEPTRTKAVVVELINSWAVEVWPDKYNEGAAFHSVEGLVDIERAFKVSAYVTEKEGKIIGRFF